MRTMRSTSASRLPPLSLILKRIRPSRGIHSSSVFGSPSSIARPDVGGLERIARANRVKDRHRRARRDRDVAIEVLALELRPEVVRQVARHERRAVGRVAAHAERLAVRVVNRRVERAGDDERAQLRDRHRQRARGRDRRRRRAGTRARARERDRSDGRARRTTAVTGRSASASAFIAPRPASCGGRGKRPGVAERHRAEAPRVLAAVRTAMVRTRQFTLRIVTRSTDRPPN